MLMPFTYAGVSAVYMYEPPAQLGPSEQFTFTIVLRDRQGRRRARCSTRSIDPRRSRPARSAARVVDAQTSAPVADASVMVLDSKGRPDRSDRDRRRRRVPRRTCAPGSYTLPRARRRSPAPPSRCRSRSPRARRPARSSRSRRRDDRGRRRSTSSAATRR